MNLLLTKNLPTIIFQLAMMAAVAYRAKTKRAPWWFAWVIASCLINPLWVYIPLELVIRTKRKEAERAKVHDAEVMRVGASHPDHPYHCD